MIQHTLLGTQPSDRESGLDRQLTFRVLGLEKANEFDLVLDAFKGLDFQLAVDDLHWIFDELKCHTHTYTKQLQIRERFLPQKSGTHRGLWREVVDSVVRASAATPPAPGDHGGSAF